MVPEIKILIQVLLRVFQVWSNKAQGMFKSSGNKDYAEKVKGENLMVLHLQVVKSKLAATHSNCVSAYFVQMGKWNVGFTVNEVDSYLVNSVLSSEDIQYNF